MYNTQYITDLFYKYLQRGPTNSEVIECNKLLINNNNIENVITKVIIPKISHYNKKDVNIGPKYRLDFGELVALFYKLLGRKPNYPEMKQFKKDLINKKKKGRNF